MKMFLGIVFVLLALPCLGQKEANEWYFGQGLGISFKNGAPTPLDGQLVSTEACASICDKNGNLLFYSDGQNVWNSKHSIMPNGQGLIGGPIGTTSGNSAAQGILIIPDPANSSRYYIFLTPEIGSPKTDKLSVYKVDMNLDNGFGDVLPELIQLNPASEKLTGTADCNGTGYWIVSHHNVNNEFYSYYISKDGLNPNPVISKVGKPQINLDENGWGYNVSCMKISPNGKMLVFPVAGNLNVEFFNFDNTTGIVSTPRTILTNIYAYGVSFSPNSEKLYINARKKESSREPTPLLQFTVNENAKEKKIVDSKKIIAPLVEVGAMQIGPDKNIYLVEYNKKYVGVIKEPNNDNPQYIQQAVIFSYSRTYFGLPNYIDNIFQSGKSLFQCKISDITSDTICADGFASFRDTSSKANIIAWHWEFPGGNPFTSNEQNPKNIHYPKSGEYTVKLIRFRSNSGTDTAFTTVLVNPMPIADAGSDVMVCSDSNAIIGTDKPEDGTSYIWTPAKGLNNPNIARPVVTPIAQSTTYFLTVTNQFGCSSVDSVRVGILKSPEFITTDVSICIGETRELSVTSDEENLTYSWTPSDGLNRTDIQNPTVTAFKSQTYYVTVTSQNSCSTTQPLNVRLRDNELITARVQSDTTGISPGKSTLVKLIIKSEYLQTGIHSFKASLTYEPQVFQFTENSIKFVQGADTTWFIKAKQNDGILTIKAFGQTPIIEAESTIELTAYLAKQTNENILLTLEEIDGVIIEGKDCRTVTSESTKLVLKEVCGGDLRLVNVGTFQTQLQQIAPNPIVEETAEIEYSLGIEGSISLEIYNQQGELVQTVFKGIQKPGIFKEMLDTGELAAGVHLCRFSTMQTTQTQTFVVVR